MARVVAVSNAKGGTGKTTCAVNTSSALAKRGQRVLLVDLDPQASATFWLIGADTGDGLVEGLKRRSLVGTPVSVQPSLDVIPCGPALAVDGNAHLAGAPLPIVLREALETVRAQYDFILIDCPPSVGPLVYNALAAADAVLVPCECSLLALAGLAQFEQVVDAITRMNRDLRIVGVQPFRMNRTLHAKEALDLLQQRYGDLLLPAVPETVAIRDAAASRQTLGDADPGHRAWEAFEAAASRLMEIDR